MSAVTPSDMEAVVLMLINKARGGSVLAAKELLDRVLGKSTQEVAMDVRTQRSPDEIRATLASLLLRHPEVKKAIVDGGNDDSDD